MTNNNEILAGLLGTAIMFLIIIAVTSVPAWIFLAIYTGIGVLFGNALQLDAYDAQYKQEQLIHDKKLLDERNLRDQEHQAIKEFGIWINPNYKKDKE